LETPSSIGKVHHVKDSDSAIKGINEIIEQGEGSGPISAEQFKTGQYGHFYRFEEIVCQRQLGKHQYAYSGEIIHFNPSGVYQMRDNPESETIAPGTDCYTEAKAFHHIYRNFLKVLQKTFNGQPKKIHRAIELMEALQAHAKKCIWTPYGKSHTCGPVWNYKWE